MHRSRYEHKRKKTTDQWPAPFPRCDGDTSGQRPETQPAPRIGALAAYLRSGALLAGFVHFSKNRETTEKEKGGCQDITIPGPCRDPKGWGVRRPGLPGADSTTDTRTADERQGQAKARRNEARKWDSDCAQIKCDGAREQ